VLIYIEIIIKIVFFRINPKNPNLQTLIKIFIIYLKVRESQRNNFMHKFSEISKKMTNIVRSYRNYKFSLDKLLQVII